MSNDSTIAALATAPIPSGVAVIRISGPRASKALSLLFRGHQDPTKQPRVMCMGEFFDPESKEVLDRGLAVFMPNPKSFTGEDVAELHLHGSPIIAQRLLRCLYSLGVTPAEPGEFTRRAFLNGKLDLTQAEAVSDIINAKSESALKIANEQLEGRLSQAIDHIGEPIRDILAELEAHIDFPEEDIEPDHINLLQEKIESAAKRTQALTATYAFGQLVKDGARVLLCGSPNVGKSSLLNALLGRERAIVSDISGTTRDLIEEEATFDGKKFIFCDSAGIRDSQDQIEKIGIELAKSRIPWADLVLLVMDSTKPWETSRGIVEYLKEHNKIVWALFNKSDLVAPRERIIPDKRSLEVERAFYLSAQTGEGVAELLSALGQHVSSMLPDKAESGEIVTNERHRNCLVKAEESLRRAASGLRDGTGLELVSADLRHALFCLEEIVGRTYTEDLLGRIFGKFCIGK